MRVDSPAIAELSSSVFDSGRRGEPKPGCDCMRCFGYCLYDSDKAARDMAVTARRDDEPFLEDA